MFIVSALVVKLGKGGLMSTWIQRSKKTSKIMRCSLIAFLLICVFGIATHHIGKEFK
jgi:hypothetical protein